MNFKISRRAVLKGGALASAALAIPQLLGRAAFGASPYQQFGGFIVLPSADEPLPSGVEIGAVYHGHVENRVAESWPDYYGGSVTLGSVPTTCPCGECFNQCCDPYGNCSCTPLCTCNCCYQGAHSHFELWNNAPVASVNPNLYCGKPMYAGDSYSWVYKWDVPI